MPTSFTHGHALLIGAGADLPNTVDDAIGLAEILVDPGRCAYPPGQVHLLTGKDAMRKAVLDGLEALRKQADAEATVIVYFSGHGYKVETSIGDAHFLMPNGYDLQRLTKTAISGRELAERLAAISAKRLLLLLDCCHAGGVGEEKAPGLELSKAPLPPEALEMLNQGRGRVLIASSREDEKSYGGKPYSAFTLALIEALCGQGTAKADGYVRVADLALHTRQVVPGRTKDRQHPILHFEQADNFTIAYYAGGEAQPKALPFAAPQIEPEPGAWRAQVATVVGDGVIVQGNNNQVVGAGATYVGGSVGGDVVTGKKEMHYHSAPDPRQIAAEQADQARQKYLRSLWRRCQSLPLTALGDDPQKQEDITLDDVYIALHTTDSIDVSEEEVKKNRDRLDPESKKRPLPALEAFLQNPRIVLLGHPGSGKSTFVRNLFARQAQAMLGKEEPLPGLEVDLLPVLVTLRDLVARLEALDLKNLSADRRQGVLADVLLQQVLSDPTTLYRTPEFASGLQQALEAGKVLLGLDGLDEVPEHLRKTVRLVFQAAQQEFGPPRTILTCRVRSYSGAAEQANFFRFTLAPFTQEQVRGFCRAWYHAQQRLGRLSEPQAQDQAGDLARVAWGKDLRRLAENPMLLTTMAIIHQKETRLPNERVKLYNLAVQVLLERWQKQKTGEQVTASDELLALLQDTKKVRRIMERLAYETHCACREQGEAADLPRPRALEILEEPAYAGSLVLAQAFLDYVDQRAGLLVGRGGEPERPLAYTFPHRTFQEYLAGCFLVNQRDAARRLSEHADQAEYWTLAIELGAEELYYNGRTEGENDVLDLAYRLLPGEPRTLRDCRKAVWAGKMVTLVGRDAAERDEISGGAAFVQRLIPALVAQTGGKLTPVERAEAGRAVARLGDPRPEIMTVEAMPFCFVPAGPFLMGSQKDDRMAESAEKPQHELSLPDFWIGKYPVSNAQFGEFVQAGGYKEERFWPEAIDANIWRVGKIHLGWAGEVKEAATDYGEPFNLPNHPVVGVTWYEALAFARWLGEKLSVASHQFAEQPGIEEDVRTFWQLLAAGKLAFSLPSEAEWEKAARGANGREYPWYGGFDPDRANTAETGIGSTSAVGCFSDGITPCECLDMSGNVWEWTRSVYGDYPYPDEAKKRAAREELKSTNTRVLRGGSFSNSARNARCASRLGYYPNYRGYFYGFRVSAASLF